MNPLDDPLWVQPLSRHREIGRPTFLRTFWFSVTLLMTAETIEIVFRNQLACRIEILRRYLRLIEECVRIFDFREAVEERDQRVIFLISHAEGRHPQFEPRPDRDRPLQKREEPRRLRLLALAGKDRRR